ncbi:MAG: ATP-grasp domain-containing protein [Candidatus Limnocylindria bacterium]
MRIAVLLLRHPPERPSPIFPEVIRLLRERGAVVDVRYPDDAATDLDSLRVEHDLYVLKSGTELALSLAGALHAAGAAILNPFPVAAACRDKVVTTRLLRAGGVPIPETFAAAHALALEPLLRDGPLVVKPCRGSQGRGVRVVRTAAELLAAPPDGAPLLAQRYHAPDGPDRKIYCIGDRCFGVERPWPARTYEEKLGRPFQPDRELRALAARCQAAVGARLLGFDVVVSEGRPYVVDLSSFPGFKGVPGAAGLLADHIEARCREVLS